MAKGVGVIGKLPQWEDTSPLNTIFGFGILKGISGDESLLVVAQVLVKVLLVAIVYGQHNLRWCETFLS